jgi:3-oxoadipate enol-lactonase
MTNTSGWAAAIALLAATLVANGPSRTQSPPPHRSFLEVDGAKLYYEECGNAPHTVVLVHDGVLDSTAWGGVWPEFCKHFHTVRYDRRGYGQSSAASHGYYPTDDLAALLRHLNQRSAAIVGSSHGGEISINFTLDHPEMVQQLVLVGAVVGGMPYTKHFLERGAALGKPSKRATLPAPLRPPPRTNT